MGIDMFQFFLTGLSNTWFFSVFVRLFALVSSTFLHVGIVISVGEKEDYIKSDLVGGGSPTRTQIFKHIFKLFFNCYLYTTHTNKMYSILLNRY